MDDSAAVVRHQTGTVTIEDGALVVRFVSTRGTLRKQQRTDELRIALQRASLKVAGTDLSIYQDEKIERMVLEAGPPEALEALLRAVRSHEAAPAVAEVLVKTYRSAPEYERDAPQMVADGWLPQGQLAGRGKINVGRTVMKGAVFLPWALLRPSRQGDPVTVTWIRNG